MEACEMAVRAAMQQVGGKLLEALVNADEGGHQGPRIPCGEGHEAVFVEYRDKAVQTVLSEITVHRAYYYCGLCRRGLIPKDQMLDVEGTSFSPGVRRMMGRVGAKESFDEGRRDLEELAGIVVGTKEVERVSEAIGQEVEAQWSKERQGIASRESLTEPHPKLYISFDGTGVPVVPSETAGRMGKGEGNQAKTREAKLGCIFTQTRLDKEGCPVRDEGSTTYVGAIETAEAFGLRIYAEGVRRGLASARQVIVLGDGAPWIWGIADEQFHGATQIVDLYHAREHLMDLGKVFYGPASAMSRQWGAARCEELERGDVEAITETMRRLRSEDPNVKEAVRKEIGYFETHAKRMRYGYFRSQGFFVGSGVMEAGCKTIVGQRLKQSGMRWTVRGANAIIALRCCEQGGRWEEFWESRTAA